MSEKPRIAFLVPAYGSIQLEAWQSHVNLLANANRFCQPSFFTASSCYVHESRNRLLELFKEIDEKVVFDWVFWLDSDIVFSYKDVEVLLNLAVENKNDLVSGLYVNFVNGVLLPMLQNYVVEEDRYESVGKGDLVDGVEVGGAGLGFVLQSGESLRKMLLDHGDRFFGFRISKRNKLVGEDNVFFELARKSGFRLIAYPSVRIGHAKVISI